MRVKKVLVIFLVIILSISIYGCKNKKEGNIQTNHVTPQSFSDVNKEGVTAEPTTGQTAVNITPAGTTPASQSSNGDNKSEEAAVTPTTPITLATPTAVPTSTPTKPVHTHSWTASKVVQPTCTAGGYTLMSCSCGETQKTNIKAALGHSFGAWETVTAATTTTTGTKKRTCSRCSYTETETIPKLAVTIPNMINEVFRLVNEQRTVNGLSPLAYRADLQQAADIRTGEIIDKFDHIRPNGTKCFTVFNDIGVAYTRAGENIAIGYTTPESVMDAWMNSPGHKENILNPNFEGIIIGVKEVNSNGYTGYAWAQLFITQ